MNRQSSSASLRNWTGAVVMMCFALIAGWRWSTTGSLFFLLLIFRDFLAAYFLVTRTPAQVASPWSHSALAYVSSGFSILYFSPVGTGTTPVVLAANLLTIAGFLLATLATIELGDRMGVAPAKRGQVCRAGAYRWFRHPMYTGYAIAELGLVLLNPLNVLIYGMSMALYLARARLEGRVLGFAQVQAPFRPPVRQSVWSLPKAR